MPVSGNLHAAEDSDGESFSDELAPTDGYFSRGEMRGDAMIPDPTTDDKKVEDKTLIPPPNSNQASTGESSRSSLYPMLPRITSSRPYASPPSSSENHSTSSPATYTPVPRVPSSRRPASFSEHTPLMNIPPPAYSESPAPPSFAPSQNHTPTSPQHFQNDSTYSTFSEHRLEQGILPPHQPQSMGEPIDADERTPLSLDKTRPSRRRSIMKKLLFIALVFAAIIALATTMLYSKVVRQNPVKDLPGVGTDHTYCPPATHKKEPVVYEFPIGSDLSVLQTSHKNEDGWNSVKVSTVGEIRLRRIPKDSEHGNRAYFTVDVHVSDPELEVVRTWDEDSRSLKISTPQYAKLSSKVSHCVSLEITAWFPEDAEFTNLLIEAIALTLRVFDDSKIKVTGRSKFATLSGDVYFPTDSEHITPASTSKEADTSEVVERAESRSQGVLSNEWWYKAGPAHPFASRRILVETLSGTIHGYYPLLDFLGLSTASGAVLVGVLPQEVSKDAPAPADLEVQTATGSIRVDLPIKAADDSSSTPPARNYITNVHSNSGSIDGTFYLGSLGSFKSTSGSIQIKALPVVQAATSDTSDDAPPSRFETHTVSGSHDIEVLDPVFITRLSSAHGQADPQPRPDPYSPVGDDEPYINIPPNVDRSLFAVESEASTKKLRNLQSKHTSSSASIQVSYPRVWEGSVHAKTVSGGIDVRGKGIRTIRERKGPAYKEVLARKGVEGVGEGCLTEMGDISGELKVAVR